MSRLTASPFHKPSPFEFPRGLPSPPETNPDMFTAGVPMTYGPQSLAGQDYITGDSSHLLGNETPTSRLRKTSSIPYHTPGFRDNKDRSSQRVLSKALIIVIPPNTLLQEHSQNVALSTGPYHRLSQGLLMPLLPSMFNQLSVIAKEFNFPSTSGICLYYHYVEDGLTLKPRISDDSWQTIWAHLSEPTSPSERRPLISGKIEFDIDHRVARWYTSWISSIFREVSDMNQYPATAPSYGHARLDSRTTLPDGRVYDDDDNSVIIQHSAPVKRHVPKKLSLVERFETSSVRPELKSAAPRSTGSPPEILPSASQAPVLSPIVQEEEPKTARQNLNSRVKTWRASAILTPTPLAATGQTSLEPANLPNGMPAELKMEDYSWSISSCGPLSYGERSPLISEYSRIRSVHLDSRLKGSVCSTPSIRTSFGPSDYDPLSPHLESFDYPSPDIAQRFFEDSPPTPLTATSWGAPLSYPPSPRNVYVRVPSPDVAQRMYEDSPSTPSTATSWGAPLLYPPSPRCVSPVPSVDLGDRSIFDDAASQHSHTSHSLWRASLHQAEFDAFATSSIWRHVWPYTETQSSSSTSAQSSTSVWPHVWPYTDKVSDRSATVANIAAGNWQHVWPYTVSRNHSDVNSYPRNLGNIYPAIDINRNDCYPYNLDHIYPARHEDVSRNNLEGYPFNLFNLYPNVSWTTATTTTCNDGYPFNLANIYPITSLSWRESQFEVNYTHAIGEPTAYPHNLLLLYAPLSNTGKMEKSRGYPLNLSDIYPADREKQGVLSWAEPSLGYPYNLTKIYPAGYPRNLDNIYGSINGSLAATIQPEAAGYPHNLTQIYPPLISSEEIRANRPTTVGYPQNLANIYPPRPVHREQARSRPQTTTYYPHHLTQLYPPVYPYNLANIYPSIYGAQQNVTSTSDTAVYPHNLDRLYPPVSSASRIDILPGYPLNLSMIYADICGERSVTSQVDSIGYPHNLSRIYAPTSQHSSLGYPHNSANIYVDVADDQRHAATTSQFDSIGCPHNLRQIYLPIPPHVSLGYPHNLTSLYADVSGERQAAILQMGSMGYPHNLEHIYAPVSSPSSLGYPHNLSNLYTAADSVHQRVQSNVSAGYTDDRTWSEYPLARGHLALGYPLNLYNIYSAINIHHADISLWRESSAYPQNLTQIYSPVYPYNLDYIYPTVYVRNDGTSVSNNLSLSQLYLDVSTLAYPFNLEHIYLPIARSFDPPNAMTHVYPFNLEQIYPPISRDSQSPQKSSSHYPFNLLNIYPAVRPSQLSYPHNLLSIYAPIVTGDARSTNDNIGCSYPFFNLYPSTTPLRFAHYSLHTCNPKGQYPTFEIYSHSGQKATVSLSVSDSVPLQSVYAPKSYPVFNLYPAVYPFFDLYPGPLDLNVSSPTSKQPVPETLTSYSYSYPTFNLYPALYPHFELYPALVSVARIVPETPMSTTLSSRLTHAELHAMVMMEEMGSFRMMERFGTAGLTTHSNDMSRTSSPPHVQRPTGMSPPIIARRTLPVPSSRISPTLPHSILRPTLSSVASLRPVANEKISVLRSPSLRGPPPLSKPEITLPVRVTARSRRDSLVVQRIRAYDSNIDSSFNKDTLAKFPMPPRMPLPPLPSERGK